MDPGARAATAQVLRDLGFAVETVEPSADVIAAIYRHRPDVLLEDAEIGGLALSELLQKIRSDPRIPTLPIVLYSGGSRAPEAREGALEPVALPFDVQQLCDALDQALPGRPRLAAPKRAPREGSGENAAPDPLPDVASAGR